ncbi:MAG: hypothetical protein GYA24_10215 [Candidatus Lokiarchaeota archaeon]|nr:hypothetical protein [Candidatus Lokiarchaeota archaeon]
MCTAEEKEQLITSEKRLIKKLNMLSIMVVIVAIGLITLAIFYPFPGPTFKLYDRGWSYVEIPFAVFFPIALLVAIFLASILYTNRIVKKGRSELYSLLKTPAAPARQQEEPPRVLFKNWVLKEQVGFIVSVVITSFLHAWITIYMLFAFGSESGLWVSILAISCVMPIICIILHREFSTTKEERDKAKEKFDWDSRDMSGFFR